MLSAPFLTTRPEPVDRSVATGPWSGTVLSISQILHVDADSFFVSVEQALDPNLAGRPVVVGHRDGMVLAATWSAKQAGIKTTMPVVQAQRLVRGLTVIPSRFNAYQLASSALHELLRSLGGTVESASIDEAFIDLDTIPHDASCTHLDQADAERCHAVTVASALRAVVSDRLGLAVSVGSGPSKLVAKLASRDAKPDGQFHVHRDDAVAYIQGHPLDGIWGIGPSTVERLRRLEIRTMVDLAQAKPERLVAELGPSAGRLIDLARGIDDRRVSNAHQAQSISVERSSRDTSTDPRALMNRFSDVLADALDRLEQSALAVQRIDVRLAGPSDERHAGKRLSGPTKDLAVITAETLALFNGLAPHGSLRRMTVAFSGFSEYEQLALIAGPVADVPRDRTLPMFDEVVFRGMSVSHARFGAGVVLERNAGGLRVRFGDRERLLDSSAPLSY